MSSDDSVDSGAELSSAKEELRALSLTKRTAESTCEGNADFLRTVRKIKATERLYCC